MTRNRKNILMVMALGVIIPSLTYASSIPGISINIGGENAGEFSETLQILFTVTVLALAPSIIMMMTSFTRIIISLHFLKSAIGTQQMPPNQIIIGLALFLTFFIMSPVITTINETAIVPYQNKQITEEVAIERMVTPIKEFMLKQTRDEDIKLFLDMASMEIKDDSNLVKDIPIHILTPAFIISEIRAGFIIGFMLFLPFMVIDMVVASVLMSMGMMMLPPAMISLPFKILIFILMDGWNLIVGQLVMTFK